MSIMFTRLFLFCFAFCGFSGLTDWSSVVAQSPTVTSIASKLASGDGPVRIVCFGDSITGVYYHTGARRAWCDMLGIAISRIYPRSRVEMMNAGISGESTVEALKRFESDVLNRKPDLVVVMFGMNDVVEAAPDVFRKNLAEIAGRCQASGSAVVLMTPNSIYPEDSRRPVERLAEYAEIVRQVGMETGVPVADCYRTFEEVRSASPRAWMMLMSETIHPNMRGHRLFAEEVAWVLAGKRVSLDDTDPPHPNAPHTVSLLRDKRPIRVLAMKPYDTLVQQALAKVNPKAVVQISGWDVSAKALPEIEREVRERGLWNSRKDPKAEKHDLVIVAIPATALASTDEEYYRSYSQILNLTISYGTAQWDTVAVLPSVNEPSLDYPGRVAEQAAMDVIRGQDIGWIQRNRGDTRTGVEILVDWFRTQLDSAAGK